MAKVGGVGNLGEVEVLWEELNRVCVPGGCSGGNVAVVTTVMVEVGEMYQPLTAFVDNEGWLEATLWTKILVQGGARGVSLKSKFPLMAAWAERL